MSFQQTETVGALKTSDLFHLISNERRRFFIKALASVESIKARDLADLAADEILEGDDVNNTIYISLIQTHLPVLKESGVVKETKLALVPTERTVEVAEVLANIEETWEGDR